MSRQAKKSELIVLLLSLFIGPRPATATDLSTKAARLKMGMSRAEAIKLLGPATWAVLPSDTGKDALPDPSIVLLLAWKNPGCTAVRIHFDARMHVIGWDEGRLCMTGAERFDLPDQFLCNRQDRRAKCT